jgi:hypothetical protein
MKRLTSVLAAGALCAGFLIAQANDPLAVLRVIPTPQEIVRHGGNFKLSAQTRIILSEHSRPEDRFAAEQINERLSELNGPRLKVSTEESIRKLSANYIFLGAPQSALAKEFLRTRGLKIRAELKDEGYVLDVSNDGIVILAEAPSGRFYGVMSLLQTLGRDKKSIVEPRITVYDWPLQKVRGITDDISRGQVSTQENFKKIIRTLAHYKLNVYSPYLEDMFVFKKHPQIGKNRGALSLAEVKELDAYAAKYHVELIPIFETLGHWENILAQPEYVKYAEFPGAHTVNISDERVYKMLDEMIGELSMAFSSPYFNMAADESWDVGLGASKERVAQSDLATVHAEHYKRLVDILKKYRKKPLMYGDIILNNPAILEKIPKDIVIVDWQYGVADRYPSPDVFRSAGFPFIVSPAVWNFTGPFPNYLNTFVNVQNFNRDGYLNGSRGILTSNWNDYGGEALRELNYYGYAWTAECAWQPLKADVSSFNRNFFTEYFGSDEAAPVAQNVYALLATPANLYSWHELWRHPMLPLRTSGANYLWRVQSIESTMPLVEEQLAELERVATRNKDQVEYLRFIAEMNRWFASKLRLGEKIRKLTSSLSPTADRDSVRGATLALLRDIVPPLIALKERFRKLWLTTNVPANLPLLLARYDQQAGYWQEKLAEVEQGELWVDPVIESQWIYHPRSNPRKRDSSATQVPKAFFRKSFTLEQSTDNARLQLLGDTDAKLWLNGKELGEVFARPSLSLTVEHQRVRTWDISPYLLVGKNVISVETANYDSFGSAGINIYSEIQTGNRSTLKVISDSTWKVSDIVLGGWQTNAFEDSSWALATAKPYPLPVIRPNLARGRSSWIER